MTLLDLSEQDTFDVVLTLGERRLWADVAHSLDQGDLVGDGVDLPRLPLRLVPQSDERHPHLRAIEVGAPFEADFDFAIAHAQLGGEVVDDVLAVDDDFHIIGCCGFVGR